MDEQLISLSSTIDKHVQSHQEGGFDAYVDANGIASHLRPAMECQYWNEQAQQFNKAYTEIQVIHERTILINDISAPKVQ